MDRTPPWAKNAAAKARAWAEAAKASAWRRARGLAPRNAANAARKRAMNRTVRNQNRRNIYIPTGRNGEYLAVPGTVMNKEGRTYEFFHGRNWWKPPKKINGPPMPNTWLPESGYGATPRDYYTMEPPAFSPPSPPPPPPPLPAAPEEVFGVYDPVTGETAYGGRRRKTRRKSRSRKTRRNSRK